MRNAAARATPLCAQNRVPSVSSGRIALALCVGVDIAERVQELEARLQTEVEAASKTSSALQLQLDDAVRERDMWKVESYASCHASLMCLLSLVCISPLLQGEHRDNGVCISTTCTEQDLCMHVSE